MSEPADRTVFPAAFSALLAAPNPTFLCKIASARTSTKRHLAPVSARLHGGMPDGPLADSLAGLLTRAAADPVEFLHAAAAYPRYADGATAIVWQPIAFSPNGEFPDAFETR